MCILLCGHLQAREVYVIGEFNNWNAYGYDMKKISDGGIYDLFIPGAKAGDMYKYLIISQSGEALYKADPYANQAQLRPETASIVADLSVMNGKILNGLRRRRQRIILKHLFLYMNVILAHGRRKMMEQRTDSIHIEN